MADCEMCGKTAKLSRVKVEETIMNVCPTCAQHGTKLASTKGRSFANAFGFKRKFSPQEDSEEYIVENYAALIRQAREQQKLKSEEFAKKLNEKESLIRKVESGNTKPSFRLAKKMQKMLHISLVKTRSRTATREVFEQQATAKEERSSGGLTMGDILAQALKKKK